jgi:WD40 repeat protein
LLSAAFSANGTTLLSGYYEHTLKIWDIRTRKCLKTINLLWIPREIKEHPLRPGIFATANGNGTVSLFDFREFFSKSVDQ